MGVGNQKPHLPCSLLWSENLLPGSMSPFLSCAVLSRVQLFATPWTVARQAPLSMEFPRQVYYSGFPFPTPGDIPDPGIKSWSLLSSALAGGFFTTRPLGKYTLSQQLLLISVKLPVNLLGQTHAYMCTCVSTHTHTHTHTHTLHIYTMVFG